MLEIPDNIVLGFVVYGVLCATATVVIILLLIYSYICGRYDQKIEFRKAVDRLHVEVDTHLRRRAGS